MMEKKGRRFCLGDIHGCHKALVQVLERSNFDYENDLLISLGDIADGWNHVSECVDELLKIKNLVVIRGNHDEWFINWLNKGVHDCEWLQGGIGTLTSYANNSDREVQILPKMGAYLTDLNFTDIPAEHITFWNNMKPYYVLEDKCFVHGGFSRNLPIEAQNKYTLMWDREMFNQAMSYEATLGKFNKPGVYFSNANNFDEIYIGHTTTEFWNKTEPIKAANVWNLDTGAGWTGKLTIMDIDTKEFFQSDIVTKLYVNERGRHS